MTVAGIVVYHPDEAALICMAATVAADVAEIVVYANSPVEDGLEQRLRAAVAGTTLSVMRPGRNVGLGAAYNELLRHACARQAVFLFILDQDSLPEDHAVGRLADLHATLWARGERPAIVGPSPESEHGQNMSARGRAGADGFDAVRTDVVISSGSLVRCAVVDEVGPFREDFFIDAIDLEWGMRANARGFSIWFARGVRMDHRLGRGGIRLPFGVVMTEQPPRRLYTYLRNQLVMMRLPHVPGRHKIKVLLTMPARLAIYLIRSRFSRETRIAIARGLVDGYRQRLGPPDDVFDV